MWITKLQGSSSSSFIGRGIDILVFLEYQDGVIKGTIAGESTMAFGDFVKLDLDLSVDEENKNFAETIKFSKYMEKLFDVIKEGEIAALSNKIAFISKDSRILEAIDDAIRYIVSSEHAEYTFSVDIDELLNFDMSKLANIGQSLLEYECSLHLLKSYVDKEEFLEDLKESAHELI